jgi:hypothetical protein
MTKCLLREISWAGTDSLEVPFFSPSGPSPLPWPSPSQYQSEFLLFSRWSFLQPLSRLPDFRFLFGASRKIVRLLCYYYLFVCNYLDRTNIPGFCGQAGGFRYGNGDGSYGRGRELCPPMEMKCRVYGEKDNNMLSGGQCVATLYVLCVWIGGRSLEKQKQPGIGRSSAYYRTGHKRFQETVDWCLLFKRTVVHFFCLCCDSNLVDT